MIWIKRLLPALPFAIAVVLTVLMSIADRFRLSEEHIAGSGFLFATPWAWLLDHDWFGHVHSRRLEAVIVYATILWIPALLYSGCFWLVVHFLGRLRGRHPH